MDGAHVMSRARLMHSIDEQIAQMYELMNSIRERELADNDPEFDPTKK